MKGTYLFREEKIKKIIVAEKMFYIIRKEIESIIQGKVIDRGADKTVFWCALDYGKN